MYIIGKTILIEKLRPRRIFRGFIGLPLESVTESSTIAI